jgi:protocatechuate 3,4-dioxygenase beta subunit
MHVMAEPVDRQLAFSAVRPLTTSTSTGEFVLAGLPPGDYEIRLAPVNQNNYVRPVAESRLIHLTSGQALTGLRLVYDESNVLSISGRITDTQGIPVPFAEIRATCPDHIGRYGHSDEDGRYVVLDVPEGLCQLSVTHDRFSPAYLADVPAGSSDVDFALEPTAAIEGRVIDIRDKLPVQQFEIAAVRAPDPSAVSRAGIPEYVSVTSPDGTFRMDVPAGSQVLLVKAIGYVSAQLETGPVAPGEALSGVLVNLQPRTVTLHGIVTDSTNKPVSGALIFVGDSIRLSPAVPPATHTGLDGTFVLTDLLQGTIHLTASHVDYPPAHVSLDIDSESAEVRMVLGPAGGIAGTVTRAGKFVAEAPVWLVLTHAVRPLASTITDQLGRFSFEHVSAGEYMIRVRDPENGTVTSSQLALVEFGAVTVVDIAIESEDPALPASE